MRYIILLLTGMFFMVSTVSVAIAEEEETETTEQKTPNKDAAIKEFVKAEKKWLAKQTKFVKQVEKIVSKVKSKKASEKAADKVKAVYLTKDGKPKNPRPKMPEGATEEDLKLREVELEDESAYKTYFAKRALQKHFDALNELEQTLFEKDPEDIAPKFSNAVQQFMTVSGDIFNAEM